MEPYEGTEPYIFMSYARKDWERVKPFLDALSNAGYRLWWDKGISAGADWLDTLLEKVEKCAVFCPLFSEAFTDSRYCLFETAWAYQKTDKTIVSLYLDSLEKDNLGRLYQHLRKFQELRLYDLTPAQFVEGLESETAFVLCKVPEWNKIGLIRWRLSVDGILEIAKNEGLPYWCKFASISVYQYDPIYECSTAPWMPYREKILSVVIWDDIDKIGDNAFYGCKSLTNVRIPDDVKAIGDGAFTACYNLTNVCIPDSVTTIGKWAFRDCSCLTNVRISDSVTEIGVCAFQGCTNLSDIRIPKSVTAIAVNTFMDCKSLTSVYIGDGVTTIDANAFMNCKNLTKVCMRDSVTEIGNAAFCGCTSLMDVRIPNGVTAISICTFQDCKSLMDVYIPDSVTKIDGLAFMNCKSLKNVEIPIGAKVADDAFPKHTRVIRRDAAQ